MTGLRYVVQRHVQFPLSSNDGVVGGLRFDTELCSILKGSLFVLRLSAGDQRVIVLSHVTVFVLLAAPTPTEVIPFRSIVFAHIASAGRAYRPPLYFHQA